jgi:hypothetical protein
MTNRSLITSELSLTIQCMIENALLHSILDTIFEQREWPWRVLKDNHRFNPLHGLLEIKKWDSLQKNKVDNTYEWPLSDWQTKRQKNKVILLPQIGQGETLDQ